MSGNKLSYEKSEKFWSKGFDAGGKAGRYAGFLISDDKKFLGKYRLKKELEFLKKIGRFGGNFLDLGCGTGNYVYSWRNKFDSLVGIDFSSALVLRARERNRNFSNVKIFKGDVRNFDKIDTRNKFRFVFIGGCFMYLNDKDIEFLLSKLYKKLEKGGVIIFREPTSNHRVVENKGKYTCIRRSVSDYVQLAKPSRYRLGLSVYPCNWVNYVYYISLYTKLFPFLRKKMSFFGHALTEFILLWIPMKIVSYLKKNAVSYKFFVLEK